MEGVGEASDLGLADGPVGHLGAFGESQDLLYLGVHGREKASSELGLVVVVKLLWLKKDLPWPGPSRPASSLDVREFRSDFFPAENIVRIGFVGSQPPVKLSLLLVS